MPYVTFKALPRKCVLASPFFLVVPELQGYTLHFRGLPPRQEGQTVWAVMQSLLLSLTLDCRVQS